MLRYLIPAVIFALASPVGAAAPQDCVARHDGRDKADYPEIWTLYDVTGTVSATEAHYRLKWDTVRDMYVLYYNPAKPTEKVVYQQWELRSDLLNLFSADDRQRLNGHPVATEYLLRDVANVVCRNEFDAVGYALAHEEAVERERAKVAARKAVRDDWVASRYRTARAGE